jgi:hypothetical protein
LIEEVLIVVHSCVLRQWHAETGVVSTRTRRRFRTGKKLRLLVAAVSCTKPGELGAILRREAQRRGELQGSSKPREPVAAADHLSNRKSLCWHRLAPDGGSGGTVPVACAGNTLSSPVLLSLLDQLQPKQVITFERDARSALTEMRVRLQL